MEMVNQLPEKGSQPCVSRSGDLLLATRPSDPPRAFQASRYLQCHLIACCSMHFSRGAVLPFHPGSALGFVNEDTRKRWQRTALIHAWRRRRHEASLHGVASMAFNMTTQKTFLLKIEKEIEDQPRRTQGYHSPEREGFRCSIRSRRTQGYIYQKKP